MAWVRVFCLRSIRGPAFVLFRALRYQLLPQVGLHRYCAAVFFEHRKTSRAGRCCPRSAVFKRGIGLAGGEHCTAQLFHEPKTS